MRGKCTVEKFMQQQVLLVHGHYHRRERKMVLVGLDFDVTQSPQIPWLVGASVLEHPTQDLMPPLFNLEQWGQGASKIRAVSLVDFNSSGPVGDSQLRQRHG
jgi:hypothetical protein